MSHVCRICQKEGDSASVPQLPDPDRLYLQDTDDDDELWLCGECLVRHPYDYSWWCYAGNHRACSHSPNRRPHAPNSCACSCHRKIELMCPKCMITLDVRMEDCPTGTVLCPNCKHHWKQFDVG